MDPDPVCLGIQKMVHKITKVTNVTYNWQPFLTAVFPKRKPAIWYPAKVRKAAEGLVIALDIVPQDADILTTRGSPRPVKESLF